ncbi:MAG: helix-turn-helix domain-containing protein [Candidatus Nanoarchaeia archaeon]
MWALKIKVREKWNIYNSRTKKFKVKIYFYSHNYYEEKSKIFYIGSGLVVGKEENIKLFFNDLKKDKKIEHFESNNDFFTCTYFESKTNARNDAVKVAYNPKIIFLKPAIIDEEGWEEWEVASSLRKDLESFVKMARTHSGEHKLLFFKEQKITNLMIYSLLPKLSKRQREILLLAVEEGYYGYPRKTTLDKLAKMMKISVSTCQFHLAKAEAKIVPFVAKKM